MKLLQERRGAISGINICFLQQPCGTDTFCREEEEADDNNDDDDGVGCGGGGGGD